MTQALTRMGSFLHPALFAIFPLLSLFVQNESEVELSVLWPLLAWCLGGVAVVYGLFLLITRRATKAGALTAVVAVGFFYFGIFFENLSGLGLREGWFVVPWLVVVAAVVVAIARTSRPLGPLTLIARVGAAALGPPAPAENAALLLRQAPASPPDSP